MPNRSYYTDGTDDPAMRWLNRTVRVVNHPEWGVARVMRWYPAAGGRPQSLRIMADKKSAPQVVPVTDIELVEE